MPYETLREHGAKYAAEVLKTCGGKKGVACQVLQVTYPTLQVLLEEAKDLGSCGHTVPVLTAGRNVSRSARSL